MSLQMIDREAPLTIVGPPGVEGWIRCFRRSLHTGFAYEVRVVETDQPGLVWEAPEYQVLCAPLEHRLFCLGYALLELGADLLIHVVTSAATLAEEAAAKGHSTVAEAAQIAREAGARRLVITHVSPRYVDADALKVQARAIFPETQIAWDGMVVELERREAE
jgi:ribonuclease BN (tRNA processing enzyme)